MHYILAAVDGSLNLGTGKPDVAQRVIVQSVQLAYRTAQLCVFHDLLTDLHFCLWLRLGRYLIVFEPPTFVLD